MGLLLFWGEYVAPIPPALIDYSIKPNFIGILDTKTHLVNYYQPVPKLDILNIKGSILVDKTNATSWIGYTETLYDSPIEYDSNQIYGGNLGGIDLPPTLYSIKNKVPRGKI